MRLFYRTWQQTESFLPVQQKKDTDVLDQMGWIRHFLFLLSDIRGKLMTKSIDTYSPIDSLSKSSYMTQCARWIHQYWDLYVFLHLIFTRNFIIFQMIVWVTIYYCNNGKSIATYHISATLNICLFSGIQELTVGLQHGLRLLLVL